MVNNNIKLSFILLYILFAIIISGYLANKPIISFFNNNFKSYDIVLSRYNEDIDWINNDPFNKFNIICYNKGPTDPTNQCKSDNCKIVKLENVGKCDHTYLHHIINNYDNLAPITLFIPASSFSQSYKYDILMKNMELLNESNSSIFYGCQFEDVAKEMNDFTIGYYPTSSHEQNRELSSDGMLKECPTRPFGKWFEENVGKDLKSTVICYCGIFIVAKEHIQNHPKEYYEKLIKFVDDHPNPEAGHYLERAWPAIFLPYPDSCIIYREKSEDLRRGC